MVNCTNCEASFDEIWKLEDHLKSHDKVEDKKCEHCGKMFYFEWRLKKHQLIHMNKNLRKCHYFNNDKACPFEDIGCMYLHVEFETTKKFDICSKIKLCTDYFTIH